MASTSIRALLLLGLLALLSPLLSPVSAARRLHTAPRTLPRLPGRNHTRKLAPLVHISSSGLLTEIPQHKDGHPAGNSSSHGSSLTGRPTPVRAGRRLAQGSCSPPPTMSNVGGPVIEDDVQVFQIFLGASWQSYYVNLQPYMTNLASNIGSTSWYSTMFNFFDTDSYGQQHFVGGNVLLAGSVIDPSGPSNFGSTADLESYIQSVIGWNSWAISPNSIFFVLGGTEVDFTQPGNTLCAQMCGFHGPSAANTDFRYAFVGSPDVCNAVQRGGFCDVGPASLGATQMGPAFGIATTFSHELIESVSDPLVGIQTAWIDSCGNEVGDKCDRSFSGITQDANGNNLNVVAGSYEYLIQDVWDPASTNGGSAQVGCVNSPSQK